MRYLNRFYAGFAIACVLFLHMAISHHAFAQTEFTERFSFSGFGRLTTGYLDTPDANYEGYSNQLGVDEQSLIAIQTDFTITDSLSLSGQLLGHSSDSRDSGLEWLYLNYAPSNNWRFKLGRLRTPFFRYSDVIDVGFSYRWISPPQQVYSGFLFSNYEGATGTYLFHYNDFNFELEAYYGTYSGEFERDNEMTAIDVDEIKGLIFSIYNGNLNLRFSTIESSKFDVDIPQFDAFASILETAGFAENAKAFQFDGKATGYQASINYDTLDYFLAAEWVKLSSTLLVVPELDAYYVTAGYNFHPFQVHLTLATSKSNDDVPENQIPLGVAPQLDQLSFVYDQITNNLPQYNLDSLTLGARWDFRHNMAAKAEITWLKGVEGENSFFSDITDPNFDRKATLYQVGLEWFF